MISTAGFVGDSAKKSFVFGDETFDRSFFNIKIRCLKENNWNVINTKNTQEDTMWSPNFKRSHR
jgi:hypothetical protein